MNIDQSGDINKQLTITLRALITVMAIKLKTEYRATGLLVVIGLESQLKMSYIYHITFIG